MTNCICGQINKLKNYDYILDQLDKLADTTGMFEDHYLYLKKCGNLFCLYKDKGNVHVWCCAEEAHPNFGNNTFHNDVLVPRKQTIEEFKVWLKQ